MQSSEDLGYQSSVSSPSEVQMKRRRSEAHLDSGCQIGCLTKQNWCSTNLSFGSPANHKQLLTLQKAGDPLSQSLPETLLKNARPGAGGGAGAIPESLLLAAKEAQLSDSIRSTTSTRSKVAWSRLKGVLD